MNIETIFMTRPLTEKKKKQYMYKELDKRTKDLKEKGYSGIEYKNMVYKAKKNLEKEIRNGIIRKYVKATTFHKEVINHHLITNNLLIHFQPSKIVAYQLPQTISSHYDFTIYISKNNLFSTIFPLFKRFDDGGRQSCIFTENNIGWISQDKQGYFRYCSKNEKTGKVIGFSLLDIVEIVFGKDFEDRLKAYQNARRRIAEILNVRYDEFDFELQQEYKYKNNLQMFNDIDWIKKNFPNLYRLIRSQLYILKWLHTFGMTNILEKRHAIGSDSVIFVSCRQIANDLKQKHNISKSHTTISSAINLFATLNLLHKIPSDQLKSKEFFYNLALDIRKFNIEYNFINFMTIPLYDISLFSSAEKIAKCLIENGITTAKQISRKNLIGTFDTDKANKVFGVKTVDILKVSANELEAFAKEALGDIPYELLL